MQSVLYSLLAGLSTVLGVYVLKVFGKPGPRLLAGLLGFAAGVMIAISLFELLPDALMYSSWGTALIGFALGMGALAWIDQKLPDLEPILKVLPKGLVPEVTEAQDPTLIRSGTLVLFGVALHNLPEGLAIGAGIVANPRLGAAMALAIALHNIPEGIAIAGPLRAGGMNDKFMIRLVLAAGLMTPVGALLGNFLFGISQGLIGGSMAFAAGAMVYIAHDELLPHAEGFHPAFAKTALYGAMLMGFWICL